jgi:hypothetical protein
MEFCVEILLNVFHYLSRSSLFDTKQTCCFWDQIITKYKGELFIPRRVETFQKIKGLNASQTIGAKSGYFYPFHPLGIRYRIEPTVCYILFHIETQYPKSLNTIKFANSKMQNIFITSVKSFILPKYFSADSQTHPTIVANVYSLTDKKLVKIFIFDLKCVEKIMFYKVDKIPTTDLEVFKLLPYFDKTKSNYNILSNKVFHHNDNYFLTTKIGSHLEIKFMIADPLNYVNNNIFRNFHCFKYAISFENETLAIYDITTLTKTPIATIHQKNAYYCHSIDLSTEHFIVLLGKQRVIDRKPEFHYLLVDTCNLLWNSFIINNEQSSFLYESSVESQSKKIVHVYCDNRIIKIDLKSLSLIE